MVRAPDLVSNVNWPWIPPSARIRATGWPQKRWTAWAAAECPDALSLASRFWQRALTAGFAAGLPALSAAAAEAGDDAELSMVFSAAACPVGPAGAGDAFPESSAAARPPPSSATSARPLPHHTARLRRRGAPGGRLPPALPPGVP